ncbi:unnamed protein product [Paramecium sonneborni]|uniref:Alpha-type protein kinase domain-containing protein n=1 Tax=Paramecium sonneborni TaxID=65129 RepID=A0A8S1LRF5_9CILI|nr:unnamed protein product [Paramecium sonneborni]
MDQNSIDYYKICIDSILCQDNQCQKEHQRAYFGLCVKFLQMNQDWENEQQEEDQEDDSNKKFKDEKCQDQNCQLWHLNLNEIQLSLSMDSSILGIFPNNLCKTLNCDKKACILIHKEWAQNICLNYIINGCRKKKCPFNHRKWKELREIAEKISQISFINPEELCMKQDNCDCGKHMDILSQYCIAYLKGWCPNKVCNKQHVDWDQIELKSNKLLPCTNQYYKYNKSFDEMLKEGEMQLLCETVQLHRFKQELQQCNTIDVVFIMDLTGSMSPWKNEMQNTIVNIINEFQQSIKGYSVRVGFVGYRDFCDKNEQISYRNLTHNIDQIIDYISKLEAKGGGDEAEDIVGGFEQAMKLNISRNPESLLCTFLIADSPCHGEKYHELDSDDYKYKMPEKYLEKVLEKYKDIKKKNFLCCVKISDTTDIMFKKMKEAFPFITITVKKQPKELSELVKFTLHQSLKQSQMIPQEQKKKMFYKASFQQFKLFVDQNSYDQQNKVNFWEEFAEHVLRNARKGQTGLEVQIDNSEFSTNNDVNFKTQIVKAFDAINNQFIILKFPKIIQENFLKNQHNEQEIKIAELQAESRFYSSSYAFQMAYFFNQKSFKSKDIPLIFYVLPTLYKLDKPLYGMTTIYGETFIDIQYLFQKYSNKNVRFEKYTTNFCSSDQEFYYYSVFSHFSYIESGGLFVIADLQGCDNIFSDPSIQTKKNRIKIEKDGQPIYILDVDDTNMKENGIEIFLQQQHEQCSLYCTELKLSREDFKQKQIIQDKSQWKRKQHISGICHLCNQFAEINLDEVQNQKIDFNLKCNLCLSEQNYQQELQCRCCQQYFKIEVQIKVRLVTNINICNECKGKCFDINQHHCYYCKNKCKKMVTYITIQQKQHLICKRGQEYLQQLKCYKCGSIYNFDKLIPIEKYKFGQYLCCDKQ